MFQLFKQVFISFLSFRVSLATKFLNNKLCLARPNLIDLNPGEPWYYSLVVDLDGFNESCNTFNYLGLLCVANKTENVYLNVFGHDKKNK